MGKRTLTTYTTDGLTVLHSIPCISLNTYLRTMDSESESSRESIQTIIADIKSKNKSKNVEKQIQIQIL